MIIKTIYISTSGDPSVGIDPLTAEIKGHLIDTGCLDGKELDEYLLEVSMEIKKAFEMLWDDDIQVMFDFEYEERCKAEQEMLEAERNDEMFPEHLTSKVNDVTEVPKVYFNGTWFPCKDGESEKQALNRLSEVLDKMPPHVPRIS